MIVVEHDVDVVAAATAVVDMGPGAGEAGGEIDNWHQLVKIGNLRSRTALYLKRRLGAGSSRAGNERSA